MSPGDRIVCRSMVKDEVVDTFLFHCLVFRTMCGIDARKQGRFDAHGSLYRGECKAIFVHCAEKARSVYRSYREAFACNTATTPAAYDKSLQYGPSFHVFHNSHLDGTLVWPSTRILSASIL